MTRSYVSGAVVTTAIGLLVALVPGPHHDAIEGILGVLIIALAWLAPMVAIAWGATGRPAFARRGWNLVPYVAAAATLVVAAVAAVAVLIDR